MIPINTLLAAYRVGAFPMAVDGRISWYAPVGRGVLPIDTFHVPRRLRRLIRQRRFRITINHDFRSVICACASRSDEEGNWISDEIIDSYSVLHEAGFAHSVEVRSGSRLVGGLYGVSLGGAFFGESMFHSETDASKVALCSLVKRLRDREYQLLDVQWLTRHLVQFGAVEISQNEYLRRLQSAMKRECQFVDLSNAGLK
jgi:leucyl/phenylalanyl-tRNA--protein transferase